LKLIPLRARNGDVRAHAIVDDEDYDWLNQWRWSLTTGGYVRRATTRGGKQQSFSMHKQILSGHDEVDHRNGNPLDNRRSNLRPATRLTNAQNVRSHRDSTSRHRGVSWSDRQQKWQAKGCIRGRQKHLGYFTDEDEAAEAAATWRQENMTYATA
jgi:hypothetical protein